MAPDLMQLVRKARGGDDDALSGIMHALLPDLRAFVRVHAGQQFRARESSSDLVQSICREVLEDLDDFRGARTPQLRKWLFTVALNKIREKHRFHAAARRDVHREAAVEHGSSSENDAHELLASYSRIVTPSRIASAKEEVDRVEHAMDELPEDYRRVITLACVMGLSHREVAEELDRPETAVRKLLSRARARLTLILAQAVD